MNLKKYSIILSLIVAILGGIPGAVFLLGSYLVINTRSD